MAYRHHKELAPTTELRHLQYRGYPAGRGQALKAQLAPEYRGRYVREILEPVDLEPIVAECRQRHIHASVRGARPGRAIAR